MNKYIKSARTAIARAIARKVHKWAVETNACSMVFSSLEMYVMLREIPYQTYKRKEIHFLRGYTFIFIDEMDKLCGGATTRSTIGRNLYCWDLTKSKKIKER